MRLREQAKVHQVDPAFKLSSLENLMKIAFTRRLAMEILKHKSET
jgi:hypothetical protein